MNCNRNYEVKVQGLGREKWYVLKLFISLSQAAAQVKKEDIEYESYEFEDG